MRIFIEKKYNGFVVDMFDLQNNENMELVYNHIEDLKKGVCDFIDNEYPGFQEKYSDLFKNKKASFDEDDGYHD